MERVSTSAAPSIGERLRTAREAGGLSIGDIADATKISPVALIAIERDQFGRLPGGVFRRAYLQAFAAAVGLDGGQIVGEYRRRFETPSDEAEGNQRQSRAQQWRAAGVVIATVVAALLFAALLLAWMFTGPPPGPIATP